MRLLWLFCAIAVVQVFAHSIYERSSDGGSGLGILGGLLGHHSESGSSESDESASKHGHGDECEKGNNEKNSHESKEGGGSIETGGGKNNGGSEGKSNHKGKGSGEDGGESVGHGSDESDGKSRHHDKRSNENSSDESKDSHGLSVHGGLGIGGKGSGENHGKGSGEDKGSNNHGDGGLSVHGGLGIGGKGSGENQGKGSGEDQGSNNHGDGGLFGHGGLGIGGKGSGEDKGHSHHGGGGIFGHGGLGIGGKGNGEDDGKGSSEDKGNGHQGGDGIGIGGKGSGEDDGKGSDEGKGSNNHGGGGISGHGSLEIGGKGSGEGGSKNSHEGKGSGEGGDGIGIGIGVGGKGSGEDDGKGSGEGKGNGHHGGGGISGHGGLGIGGKGSGEDDGKGSDKGKGKHNHGGKSNSGSDEKNSHESNGSSSSESHKKDSHESKGSSSSESDESNSQEGKGKGSGEKAGKHSHGGSGSEHDGSDEMDIDVTADGKLSILYKWKYIAYEFKDEKHKQEAIDSGDYIPSNCVPIDVDVYHDKTFVSVIRDKGVVSSLNIIGKKLTSDGQPMLKPYPDWSWTKTDNCDSIISVYRMAIDMCDRLWVLDTGVIGDSRVCPARLHVFNLKNDQRIMKVTVPDDVAINKTTGNGLLATPAVKTSDDCQNFNVYMADVDGYALVTYDGEHFSRFSGEQFVYEADETNITVASESFSLQDGVLGLAIDNSKTEESRLWSAALAGRDVYLTDLNELTYGKKSEDLHSKRLEMYRSSQSTALAITKERLVFYSPVEKYTIVYRHASQLSESEVIVAKDKKRLQFVSGLKIIPHKHTGVGDKLVALSNRFQKIMNHDLNTNEVNFRILEGNVEELVYGTSCHAR